MQSCIILCLTSLTHHAVTRFTVLSAQTRRINVTDLWDSTEDILSFNKLIAFAQDFALAGTDGKDTVTFKVTYIDEDGDKIDISSNEELMDSFFQTVKKQPFRPFRITATTCVPNSQAKTSVDASTTPIVKTNRPVDVRVLCGDKLVNGRLVAKQGKSFHLRGPGRCGAVRQKQLEDLMVADAELINSGVFIHARHTW